MEPVPLAAKANSIERKRRTFGTKDFNLMLSIPKQPPEIWYKDQCGRKGTFKIHVQRGDHICSFCHSFRSLQVQLLYESGKPVENQNILQAQSGNCLNTDGASILALRISQVSKNHQNQNKRKASVELTQADGKQLRPDDRTDETVAANEFLPFKSDELDTWEELSGNNWDVEDSFFKEHAQIDLMWANAAHTFLKRLQFTLPGKAPGKKYECLICRHQYSENPHHDASCDLGLLLEPLESSEDSCSLLPASRNNLYATSPVDDQSESQVDVNRKHENKAQRSSATMDDGASRRSLTKLSGFSALSLPSGCPSFSCGLPDHLSALVGDQVLPSNTLLSITPSLSREMSPEILECSEERTAPLEGLQFDANILCSLSEVNL
ncbi:unnamed protein product [Albugo candida]|nr:unnamed protein product [Albugo candida]|eukprot:CCI43330.1 unnamed protein product [Albugo candida]